MNNKLSLLAALFFFAQTSFAQGTTASTTITYLSAYTNYGGGDILVRVASPVAGCDGYWIAKSDGGFHMTFALLSMALSKRLPVQITHESGQLWNGSSSKFCKIYMAEVAPPLTP